MKHPFVFIGLLFLLISCTEKTVLLPETDSQLVTEINDVSPVYFFYDEETEDVEFNRKNIIGSTNWLVNIDKRLTLNKVLPGLRYLQQKRNKDGLHNNPNAKNFFSCSNPDIQNLAFIDFTNIKYRDYALLDSLTNNLKQKDEVQVLVDFRSLDEINIKKETVVINSNTEKLLGDLKIMLDKVHLEKQIILAFNKNLTVQEYITFKSLILRINTSTATISNDEFINN
jgi:hypothetical protein